MKREHINAKIWLKTRDAAKLLAALTGESVPEVLDRVIAEALEKAWKDRPPVMTRPL